jgi:Cu(I)/Ag(I) efflux system membrane fusion protein
MKYFLFIFLLISATACKNKVRPVAEKNDSFYTCSMHPQVMQETPGKCPICGMKLIAVKKGPAQEDGIISLSDQQVQLGNISADTIGKNLLGDKTVLTATLAVDETKSTTINGRIAGRIDKLYFKSPGDFIQKGDRLYDLYSEALNNAKQEYLLALEKQTVLDNSIIDFKQVVESSRNKLLLWGMTETQIRELGTNKTNSPVTTFYSPADGYVSELQSHEGDYISEGTTIFRLSNLSNLWAEAQVYASQLSQIDHHATALVRIPDLSKEIKGQIDFVSPEINPATRINLIRVSVPNSNGQLKPGMPAYVELRNRQNNALTLPAGSVIRTGRGSIVWLMIGHNTYKSVMVETGLEDDDRVEIKSGLKTGDIVVTQGAYLLNSEYIFKHGADPMAGMDMNVSN